MRETAKPARTVKKFKTAELLLFEQGGICFYEAGSKFFTHTDPAPTSNRAGAQHASIEQLITSTGQP